MADTAAAVTPEAGVAVGLAVAGDWEVPGAVGVAAPADEVAGLVAAGEPVRASSRAPRPGEFPGGVEVARFDLADPARVLHRSVFASR